MHMLIISFILRYIVYLQQHCYFTLNNKMHVQHSFFNFSPFSSNLGQQITKKQLNVIYIIVNAAINQITTNISQQLNINFTIQQVLSSIILSFTQQNQLSDTEILKTTVQMLLGKQISRIQAQIGMDILKGTNNLGRFLNKTENLLGLTSIQNYNNWLESLTYSINEQHDDVAFKQKIDTFLTSLFCCEYNKYCMRAAVLLRNRHKKQKKELQIIKFLKQFKNIQIIKQQGIYINKNYFIEQFTEINAMLSMSKTQPGDIEKLYDKYLEMIPSNAQLTNKSNKYNTINFIRYLLSQQTQRAISKNNEDVEEICDKINNDYIYSITSITQLQKTALQTQKNDCTKIWFQFTGQFTLNTINDDIFILFLENVQKRLLMLYSNNKFIIFRRIQDNKIAKQCYKYESSYWQDNIKKLVNQLQYSYDYDVILSGIASQSVGNLKIRYLNFANLQLETQQNNVLFLQYPKMLISLTLINSKVSNLSQCVSLQNFYSSDNTFQFNEISNFSKLKRFSSENDVYITDQSSMLEVLIQNNKLEYISIKDSLNMIRSCTLSQNIKLLRHLFIKINIENIKIVLNIKDEFPNNLRTLKVIIVDYKDGKEKDIPVVIEGNNEKVNYLMAQLRTQH